MSRPTGLGRGLSALIPATTPPEMDHEESTASPDARHVAVLYPDGVTDEARLEMVSVSAIHRNPHQPRQVFDGEKLSDLAASIREVGVLQPVLLRKAGTSYELVAGERRWLAAQQAGLVVIPAVVRNVADQDSLEQSIVENLHRDDLNPLEEAAAYRRLMDEFGLAQHEVAVRVGRSRPTVANTVRLLELPENIQRLLVAREISAGHARSLLSVSDRQIQQTLVARIVAEGLSVRQTEDLVRSLEEDGRAATKTADSLPAVARDAMVLEVEQALSGRFETTVRVVTRGKRGRVVVEFADREDLQRIFGLLTN
ncbi:MAG: ParB/RepB/Spo0J family partition protein [Actinomycetota bacterium]|nr:ParB/RepB/Spo0J family partition protein [Actinomycetota bacterium]